MHLFKRLASVSAVAVLAVSGFMVTASPASAHTVAEAVSSSAGCNWTGGYNYSGARQNVALRSPAGNLYGWLIEVNLVGSGYCAITLKREDTELHDTPSRTVVRAVGVAIDRGNYSHFAAVRYSSCPELHGALDHPRTNNRARGVIPAC